jgi:DNA-binding NtrC family response regulator
MFCTINQEGNKLILIIESDTAVRKKLSDLLSRERIIGLDSVQQMLEMLCKFKNEVNVIVTDINQLAEIISKKIVFKLCGRLRIDTPPIVGICKGGDENTRREFEKRHTGYKVLKYNSKDHSFPELFIETIKEVYPHVRVDIEKARDKWSGKGEDEELIDIRKWIAEEGFSNTVDKKKTDNSAKPAGAGETPSKGSGKNYEKLYFELKKKYDELLEYVKELTDTV